MTDTNEPTGQGQPMSDHERLAILKNASSFDPSKYLTKVGNADYLEVKWRLVWLRDRHPDAHIDTEIFHLDPGNQLAVVKATISIPGGGSATGIGSETASDFREYIEKAETKAIGRALAALGYGTQFSRDHDFQSDARNNTTKVVDSPVAAGNAVVYQSSKNFNAQPPAQPFVQPPAQQSAPPANDPGLMSPKQWDFLRALGTKAGLDETMLNDECLRLYAVNLDELSRRDASAFIKWMQDQS